MASYYVDIDHVNASDGNVGTDASFPWLTIAHAKTVAVAGDTVVVKGGTYPERVTLTAVNANTTWTSEPRRTANIEGFVCQSCDAATIDGFNIAHTIAESWLGGGIWMDADDVTVNDCYSENLLEAMVLFNWVTPWCDNVTITNCRAYSCQRGFFVMGSNCLVENNEVERLIQHQSGDCDYSRFFGASNILRGNTFHGTLASEIGSAHVDGFQTFGNNNYGSHDCIIEQNYVESFHEGVILSGDFPNTTYDNTIRNNVFVGGDLGGSWGVLVFVDAQNIKVYNNTFVDLISHGVGVINNSSATVKNNIFYNVLQNYWADGTSTVTGGTNCILNGNGLDHIDGTDLRDVDPLFIDYAIGDYRLQSGSPCIDAGTPSLVTLDYDGATRDASTDIGAYEYFSPAGAAPYVIITCSESSPTAVTPLLITFTFSEAVTGFTDSDIVVTGGSKGLLGGSGAVYTLSVTQLDGQNNTITVDVAADVCIDADGNGNTAATQFTIITDSVAPTVSSVVRANVNPNPGATVDFTVTFDEAVTGVDVTDFTLTTGGAVTGAAVASVVGSGATRTVTVNTGTGDGTIRLDVLDDDTIVDRVNWPLSGGYTSGEVYTITKPSGPPTIPVEYAIVQLLNADTVVTNVRGTNIYPVMGDVTADTPYQIYQRISTVHNHHMGAASGLQTARIQIDSYADTYALARYLAEASRHALQGFRGTVTVNDQDVVIKRLHLESDNDVFIHPAHGEGVWGGVSSQDYMVGYVEDVPTF